MPRFKVLWSGTIFVTSFVNAENKEKAVQKTEDGNIDLDNIDEINDIEVEECNEIY